VVNYISGDVSIIDPTSNAVIGTVPGVGAGPQHVTYAPDGRHFYMANVDDGTVAVVDASTGAVTARIPSGRQSDERRGDPVWRSGVRDQLRRRHGPSAGGN
jgi:YVTN family beta-propeller protein